MSKDYTEATLREAGWTQRADGSWHKATQKDSLCVMSGGAIVAVPPPKPKKRIRQTEQTLNVLEQEFYDELKRFFDLRKIYPQAIRFKLANGLTYTPDFVVFTHSVVGYEVKGEYAFDGALDKLKMAATVYPEIKWRLAWKNGGKWQYQEVLS